MPTPDETKLLIERIRSGDMDAFGIMSERIRPSLMRYIYNLTQDRDMCESIVQQTLAKALASIPTIRPGPFYFSAWLYTIAANLVRDGRRRGRAIVMVSLEERASAADDSDIDEYVSSVGTPVLSGSERAAMDPADIIADSDDLSPAMARALGCLSPIERQLLVARSNGYSYQELMEETGMDWPSVKSILDRSKRAMRHSLSV